MTMPVNATAGEKLFHSGLRIFCGLTFFFLVAPVLVIMPLSFNQDPFFTYPMSGFSLRWYNEIFGDSP